MVQNKKHVLHKDSFHWLYTLFLFINSALIGLMAIPDIQSEYAHFLDKGVAILTTIITGELIWRLYVEKKNFFKDYRNLYTLIVLSAALATGRIEVTVLLLLSSLKAFHRIKFIPKTRHLIEALGRALPGAVNLIVLILMVFFVFAVLGTHLFGANVPHLWGGLCQSLVSLQQMSLSDDWGANLRATMENYPYAWIFFQAFLIIMTYMLLNLFIGIIVDALQSAQQTSSKTADPTQQILQELTALKKQLALLTQSHLSKPRVSVARKKKDVVDKG